MAAIRAPSAPRASGQRPVQILAAAEVHPQALASSGRMTKRAKQCDHSEIHGRVCEGSLTICPTSGAP